MFAFPEDMERIVAFVAENFDFQCTDDLKEDFRRAVELLLERLKYSEHSKGSVGRYQEACYLAEQGCRERFL